MSGTDVLYFNVPGMDIVVLSTSEAVIDLLERRSAIYSDKVRSSFPMRPFRYLPIPSQAKYPHGRVVSLSNNLHFTCSTYFCAVQDWCRAVEHCFHALRATLAHASKAVQRVLQHIRGKEI